MWFVVAGYIGVCTAFYAEMFRHAPIVEEDEERMACWQVEPVSFLLTAGPLETAKEANPETEIIHMPSAIAEKRAA